MKSYIITGDGVSMYIDGKSMSAENSHPKYEAILDAIRADDWDSIPNLVNTANAIVDYAGTSGVEVDVYAGVVRYNGEVLRNYLVERILDMMAEGFNIDPLATYLENLMLNPSNRAVNELHGFNEYGKMPITEDGCFIAYKRIRGGYDTYTGSVLNKPASTLSTEELARLPYTVKGVTVELVDGVLTVSMARNAVDDRAEVTCSQGLHFCSQEYLKSFSGDQIVVLKINPADVVSIPVDYNNTKGRCAKYQVIDILSQEDFDKAMDTHILNESVYRETDDGLDGVDDDDWDDSDWDDSDWEELDDDGIEYDFTAGYVSGYSDGRKGYDNSIDFAGQGAEGYAEGLKDGKGHKPKRFN